LLHWSDKTLCDYVFTDGLLQLINPSTVRKTSKAIALSGLLLGFFLSAGVLSGDELGRINLLYFTLLANRFSDHPGTW